MNAIQTNYRRKAVASWRKAFKQQWKQFQNQDVSSQNLHRYHTDPVKRTCGCESFLPNRLLACKHIVHCFEEFQDSNEFFGRVRRQRSCPFWVERQLILRPQFEALSNHASTNDIEEADELNVYSDSNSDSCEDSQEYHDDDQLVSLEDETPGTYNYPEFKQIMQRAMDISDEQEARGHTKFVEKFINSNSSNRTLVEEIEQLNNRQNMPQTWAPRKHPATMYYSSFFF